MSRLGDELRRLRDCLRGRARAARRASASAAPWSALRGGGAACQGGTSCVGGLCQTCNPLENLAPQATAPTSSGGGSAADYLPSQMNNGLLEASCKFHWVTAGSSARAPRSSTPGPRTSRSARSGSTPFRRPRGSAPPPRPRARGGQGPDLERERVEHDHHRLGQEPTTGAWLRAGHHEQAPAL